MSDLLVHQFSPHAAQLSIYQHILMPILRFSLPAHFLAVLYIGNHCAVFIYNLHQPIYICDMQVTHTYSAKSPNAVLFGYGSRAQTTHVSVLLVKLA